MTNNTHWYHHKVNKQERSLQIGQKPCLIWFTGLSGAGKSTVAGALEVKLFEMGYRTYLLDGDNVRQGLNQDLGFSDQDRVENIRRIGEVSKLFVDGGLITISAFISPFRSERAMVRELLEEDEFIEVYVSTSLEVCEERDPKGLYKKARAGEIPNFTGIGSAYEAPENPELSLDTANMDVDQCVEAILDLMKHRRMLFRKAD